MIKEPFSLDNEHYLLLDGWNDLIGDERIIAGFTTKNGGDSNSSFSTFNLGLHVNDDEKAVARNRNKLANLLSYPTSQWACAEQVHDNKIVKVTKELVGKGVYDYSNSIKGTDGLYTAESNLLLTLCYADCVPLYFFEKKHQLVGGAHAGWKGTVKNIAGEMVRTWVEVEGANPNDIMAAIGPSIGPCCYVVDDYVINFVHDALENTDTLPYKVISKGQYALDLKKLNMLLMIQSGISRQNIVISNHCTSCEDNIFFSHRRDKGNTGRMMSFIGKKGG
ncbi:peptidoglycan editing factor PgeF [Evansella sp. AB-P1]|uniref:peptidoglycan editing factor PgeF n=1 Tax=Evansella sp. AB-P1 TaxID=3037653 RepID=UPI00241C1C77|nr:peptidoglycan editing factor PgeF [Evansella sp. AB-P1]MDG5788487.1 peptidoglycan editing factor PgeF [Evansella sp. AB-P1]